MKLFYHDFGSAIAIGIEDSCKQEIEFKYFSFYNHQATSGELHWITDTLAYFWTTPEELGQALIGQALFNLLNVDFGKSKGLKRGLMPKAQELAKQMREEIVAQEFLGKSLKPDEEMHVLGYLEYTTPDLSWYAP